MQNKLNDEIKNPIDQQYELFLNRANDLNNFDSKSKKLNQANFIEIQESKSYFIKSKRSRYLQASEDDLNKAAAITNSLQLMSTAVQEFAERDGGQKMLNLLNNAKAFAGFFGYLGGILTVVGAFLPGEQDQVLAKLDEINRKLDDIQRNMDIQFDKVFQSIEYSTCRNILSGPDSSIRAAFKRLVALGYDPENENFKTLFMESAKDVDTNLELVIDSLLGNGQIGCNLFEVLYTGVPSGNFYKGWIEEIVRQAGYFYLITTQGVQVVSAYLTYQNNDPEAWRSVNTLYEENINNIVQRVNDFAQRCDDEMNNNVNTNMNIILEANKETSHETLSSLIIDEIQKVYPEYMWISMVYNDISGFDQHTFTCNEGQCFSYLHQNNKNVVLQKAARIDETPNFDYYDLYSDQLQQLSDGTFSEVFMFIDAYPVYEYIMNNFGMSGAFVAVRGIDLWFSTLESLDNNYRSFVGNDYTIIVWSFGQDVSIGGNEMESVLLTSDFETDKQKLISVYVMLNTNEQITRLLDQLNNLGESRMPFNKIIISFAKPSLDLYSPGSLAFTGIGGYFDFGDGNGDVAFTQLQEIVTKLKEKNVIVYLAVGGWVYSCNVDVYGNICGATEGNFDWFLDVREQVPNMEEGPDKGTYVNNPDLERAQLSYDNLVQLAVDLGVDGIDFDYEESWHADKFAQIWRANPQSVKIAKKINQDGINFSNLIKYGTEPKEYATFPFTPEQELPYVMPETVLKVYNILLRMKPGMEANGLKLSMAAPTVGARPITGFVWGDNVPDIYDKGGLWRGGNLKGLLYHLIMYDKEQDSENQVMGLFNDVGVMTYDLCGDPTPMCQPIDGVEDLSLPNQVDIYMKDFKTWFREDKEAYYELNETNSTVNFYMPKYNANFKLLFGVEVNKPAVHGNSSYLQLTDENLDQMLEKQSQDLDGLIIWHLYSEQNTEDNGAHINTVLKRSCETFLIDDIRYDCNVKLFD